jgi:hypothetical protein
MSAMGLPTRRHVGRWPRVGLRVPEFEASAERRIVLGQRASKGSGYERVDPVMPHRPVVPAGAPAEPRRDAKKADVIPEYPY